MHFVLMYDFDHDFAMNRLSYRRAHLERIKEAYDSGALVIAGAFSEPLDGSIMVFREAPAAEKFAMSDPYVANGLVKTWRVRKWDTVIGDGTHIVKA